MVHYFPSCLETIVHFLELHTMVGVLLTPWGCYSCVAGWESTLLSFKLMHCAELAALLACSSLSKHRHLSVCRKYSVYCSVWQECAGSHDGHVTLPFVHSIAVSLCKCVVL